MYKNKPVIIQKRPWYRHPVFPWGWYSMSIDPLLGFDGFAKGFYKPNDGGGGRFKKIMPNKYDDNSGTYIGTKFKV